MKKSVIYFVLVIIFLGSCNKRPDNVLSDSEMESLMTDLILADAYERSALSFDLPDSVRRNLGDAVLKAHGVDRATLDSTYAWYARNLDDYYKLYARVDKRLNKLNKNARKGAGNDELRNDIWNLSRHLMLSPLAKNDAFVFELPGESLSPGEKIEWYMRFNSDVHADVMLGVDYNNGGSYIVNRPLSGSKNIALSLMVDTALHPTRLYGSIYVPRREMPVWIDSIRLTILPFDSAAYSTSRLGKFYMPPKRSIHNIPSLTYGEGASGFQSLPESNVNSNTNTSLGNHASGGNNFESLKESSLPPSASPNGNSSRPGK